jgi:hypothetical protein
LRRWQRPILIIFSILDVKMFEHNAFQKQTIAALFVSFLIAAPGIALAQGSAGGSIGNDDKSLSGSRPEPRSVESERSTRRSKPQDSKPQDSKPQDSKPQDSKPQESEPRRTTSGGGSFDGAWVVLSVGCGGSSTNAVVVSSGRIIGEGIVSGRVSPGGAASAVGSAGNGVTVISSGHLSGRGGSGSFRRSDGCSGRWTASKQ